METATTITTASQQPKAGSAATPTPGALVGTVSKTWTDISHVGNMGNGSTLTNLYVDPSVDYGTFESIEQALASVKQLTAGTGKPAAVILAGSDGGGTVTAHGLLEFGGTVSWYGDGTYKPAPLLQPVAASLEPAVKGMWHVKPTSVNVAATSALFVVDGENVWHSSLPAIGSAA